MTKENISTILFGILAFGTPVIIITGLMVIISNQFLNIIGMIISFFGGIAIILFFNTVNEKEEKI